MRFDTALGRVTQSFVEIGARCGNPDLLSSESRSINYHSLSAVSPPICAGYFNVTGPGPDALPTTEVFSFPPSHALLLHRITILSREETALNGSVVGRTSPAPHACSIKIWASNSIEPRPTCVRLEPCTGQGSLSFAPADDAFLVTDKIVLQCKAFHVTLCIFGWAVDANADSRTSICERFLSSGISSRVGRTPVSRKFLDVCPKDAEQFQDGQQSALPSSKLAFPAGSSPAIYVTTSAPTVSIAESVVESICTSIAAESRERSKGDSKSTNGGPTHGNGTFSSGHKVLTPAPPTQKIMQLACNLIPEIRRTLTGEILKEGSRGLLLSNSFWRKVLSILIWPLQKPYQRFLSLVYKELHSSNGETNEQRKEATSLQVIQYLKSVGFPVFDAASATGDQKALCLSVLGSVINESGQFLDLFLALKGHRATAAMAGIELSSTGEELSSFVPHKLQVVSLRLLKIISGQRKGLEAVITPEAKTTPDAASRLARQQACLQICHNVKVLTLFEGCVHAATSLQHDKSALLSLVQGLTCFLQLLQWDPSRQQEIDDIGDNFGSTWAARVSRLAQVGSQRGERNDGFGVDNQPYSAKQTYEESVTSFLKLVEGTAFLSQLIESYGLLTNENEKLSILNCTDEANDVRSYSICNEISEEYRLKERYQIVFGGWPRAELMGEASRLIFELISWIVTSSVGSKSFISVYGCNCIKCFDAPDLFKTDRLVAHRESSLVQKLPEKIRNRLKQYVKARELVLSVARVSDEDKAANNTEDLPIDQASRKREREDEVGCKTNSQSCLKVSLENLRSLSFFLVEPCNREALVTVFKDDFISLGKLFADLLAGVASMYFLDKKKNEGTLSLEQVEQDAGVVCSLKLLIEVIHCLLAETSGVAELAIAFGCSCGPLVSQLGSLAQESCSDVTQKNYPASHLKTLMESNPSTAYGVADLTIDAYDTLENTDGYKGGLLQSLVPASLSTSVQLVFLRDQVFARKTAAVAAIVAVVSQADAAYRGETALAKGDLASSNLPASNATATEKNLDSWLAGNTRASGASTSILDSLPSMARLTLSLLDKLHTCARTPVPKQLVPTSESVEIATAGATGQSDSAVASRLGGFSGTLGVPTLDFRWSEKVKSEQELTESGTDWMTEDLSCLFVETPAVWTAETLMCLTLLNEKASSLSSRHSIERLANSLGTDQLAFNLRASCLDDAVTVLQNEQQQIRSTLASLLTTCAAAMTPSITKLIEYNSSRLEGSLALAFSLSVKSFLPIMEEAMKFLHQILDVTLPAAPFPVSPVSSWRVSALRPSPSISRFALTSGAAWTPGELTDSALLDIVVVSISQLLQVWNVLGRFSNPDIFVEHALTQVVSAVEAASASLRLWAFRCPNSVPAIMSTIIRHARLAPPNFACAPLLLCTLGGLTAVLPSNDATISFEDSMSPLMAQELNGAEGRNLEAVVARLKQMYLQKRQLDSMRTGVGAGASNVPIAAGAGTRLPQSMTTLTLSARCWFPALVGEALFGASVSPFIKFQIPLVMPLLPRLANGAPPLTASHCGPAGCEWIRRRLGRLSMGDDGDVLEVGIFKTEGTKQKSLELTVPEWAGWDKLRDLLYESLEEESVESALESDRVPIIPLGLTPAAVSSITESRAAAKEMSKALYQEASLSEERRYLSRLERISRTFKYLKLEDIAEVLSLMVHSSLSSNLLLHATTVHAMAMLTITKSVPIFDVLVATTKAALQNLSAFLAQELGANKAAGISRLFLISKLLLLIENAFKLFPAPTIEASICLIQLGYEGLRALQDVPVIDPSCPTYPVLMGLFDCILPASVRVFRSGLIVFCNFCMLLSQPLNVQLDKGLSPPPFTEISPGQGTRFGNLMVSNQFTLSLRKATATARSGVAPNITAAGEAITDLFASIRQCCAGLSAVLNQLPVAWDISCRVLSDLTPLESEDVNKNWTGLSADTVDSMISVLELLASSKFLCAISLFDVPGAFIETYLETIQKCALLPAGSSSEPLIANIAVSATADPTIKLESFIVTLIEALCQFSAEKYEGKLSLTCESLKEQNLVLTRLKAVLGSVRLLISLAHSLQSRMGINSASLVLSCLSSEPVSLEFIGSEKASVEQADEAAQMYDDIETVVQKTSETAETLIIDNSKEESATKEFCLVSLLRTLKELAEGLRDQKDSRLGEVKELMKERILQVDSLLSSIQKDATLEPPLVILRAPQLFDDILFGSQNIQSSESSIFNIPSAMHLRPSMTMAGIPLLFCRQFSGVAHPFVAHSVSNLMDSMKNDPIWRNCTTLDTVQIPNSVISKEADPKQMSSSFICLPTLLQSIATGEHVSTSPSAAIFFDELRLQGRTTPPKPSAIYSGSAWRVPAAPTPLPTPIPRTSFAGATATPAAEVTSQDPFRARKVGPSSRPPSKHVDEFEADQLAAAAAAKAEINPHEAAPEGQDSSLANIPQWTDFVAHGMEQGIDVMEILQTPQLLQDPQIEIRFRHLVDSHPSIKTLFKMMDLNL